jgi:hypothetical protein
MNNKLSMPLFNDTNLSEAIETFVIEGIKQLLSANGHELKNPKSQFKKNIGHEMVEMQRCILDSLMVSKAHYRTTNPAASDNQVSAFAWMALTQIGAQVMKQFCANHGLDMPQVELSPQEDEELASLGLGSGRSKLCQIVSGAIPFNPQP